MVFIMPVLTSIKLWLVLILLIPASVSARDSEVSIKNLKFYKQEQNYYLDADVKFHLSATVEEALRHGVALVWAVQVKVWKKNHFFWDTEQVKFIDYYRIRYHALLDLYQVKNEQSQTIERFNSLRAAFAYLGKLRAVSVAAKKDLSVDAIYQVGLQIALDKEQLPLPLRSIAYINKDWSLASRWRRMPLNP